MIKAVLLILAVALIVMPAETFASDSLSVNVTVSGFRNKEGLCRLLVFTASRGFPEDHTEAFLNFSSTIQDTLIVFSLMLTPGQYAFSILHDENSNEKLDKNLFGKPKEGFGVSNNPAVRLKAPSFEEAIVTVDEDNTHFIIKLIYL